MLHCYLFLHFYIWKGLEYVDGACFMSCVVTNNWSDWSTQAWNSNKLAIRIHKIQDDYVVSWNMVHCQQFYSNLCMLVTAEMTLG